MYELYVNENCPIDYGVAGLVTLASGVVIARDRLKTVEGYKFTIAKLNARIAKLKKSKKIAKTQFKKNQLQKAINITQQRRDKLQDFLKIKMQRLAKGQSTDIQGEDALLDSAVSDTPPVDGVSEEFSAEITQGELQQNAMGAYTGPTPISIAIIAGVVGISGYLLYTAMKKD